MYIYILYISISSKCINSHQYTLWWFKIASENGPYKYIVDFPINTGAFNSYFCLPEGKFILEIHQSIQLYPIVWYCKSKSPYDVYLHFFIQLYIYAIIQLYMSRSPETYKWMNMEIYRYMHIYTYIYICIYSHIKQWCLQNHPMRKAPGGCCDQRLWCPADGGL